MKHNNSKIISGKKKPINTDVEELQKCADFIAQLIVSNTEKYAPLMVIYDRLEREIEIARSHENKFEKLRLRVRQLTDQKE